MATCNQHHHEIWNAPECSVCKREWRIAELEDKLLGCNRDRKEYRKQIDQLAKEKQDLAAQCARLRRKSREGADRRIEELEADLKIKNALIDRAISACSMYRDQPIFELLEHDMRKAREGL